MGDFDLATLVPEACELLNCNGAAQLAPYWSLDELYEYAEAYISRLARNHGLFAVYDQSQTTVAGQANYSYPTGGLDVAEVDVAGTPLWPTSVSELQALDLNWEDAVATGKTPTSRYCQNYLGFDWIRLYPAPASAGAQIGMAGFVKPDDISASYTTVPTSAVLGDATMLATVAEARLKEGQAQMPEAADAIKQILTFYEKCALAYWGGGL